MLKSYAQLLTWCAGLNNNRHRGIVHLQALDEKDALLTLNAGWPLLQQALGLCAEPELAGLSYCSETSVFSPAQALHVNQARACLGRTQAVVVFNAFAGLNPNVFAMLVGCIQAGGVLILLSPKLEQWPSFDEPDYQKLSAVDDNTRLVEREKLFLTRGQQLLRQFVDQTPHHYLSFTYKDVIDLSFDTAAIPHELKAAESDSASYAKTADQSRLIEALCQQFTASRQLDAERVAAVVEGARGRGKSTCIGLYLSAIFQQYEGQSLNIVVSAVHRSALESLFLALNDDAHKVVFKPLDELVNSQELFDIIVIDEAAAVSTQVLKQCLGRARQTIFSTTTAGYEGNGRGFSIRFKQLLQQTFKADDLLAVSLLEPIRYAANDPVEAWLNTWFLLDATASKITGAASLMLNTEAIQYRLITQNELASNERLLQGVFGLLLEAHYQTSADDARFILDYPSLVILVAYYGDIEAANIIGATLLVHEGSFDEATCHSFETEPRRLRGHILPQQLANSSAVDWLRLPFLRIVRIAVLDECRNVGIGQNLLAVLEDNFPEILLGASFALNDEVVRFWLANNYQLMQVGMKAESSTGSIAAIVLKPPLVLKNVPDTLDLDYLWSLQKSFFQKDCLSRLPYLAPLLDSVSPKIQGELLAAEVYQLQRFCLLQMSVFQVSTALGSLLAFMSASQFQQDIHGHQIDLSSAPCERLTKKVSWKVLSNSLHSVWVLGQPQKQAEQVLDLNGKKSWQILCREYCKIALNQ